MQLEQLRNATTNSLYLLYNIENYQDNKYYVYDKLKYTDQNNPLGNNEGTLIDDTSLLYGHYLILSGVIA